MKKRLIAVPLAAVLLATAGLVVDETNKRANLTDEVIFIGDSMTANYVGIGTLFPKVINAGIPGQNSKQIQMRFSEQVLSRHPKFVHILAGTNDDIRAEPDKAVSKIIDMALMSRIGGATVVIGTIPPYNENIFWQAPYALPFNIKLMREAEANGIVVADYYPAMIGSNGLQNRELFMEDGIHQNGKGAKVMVDVLTKAGIRSSDQSFRDYLLARYRLLMHRIKYFEWKKK